MRELLRLAASYGAPLRTRPQACSTAGNRFGGAGYLREEMTAITRSPQGSESDVEHQELRRALLDGVMVVVPIGAIVLLVLAILRKVQDASEPVSGPIGHPVVVAVVLLKLLCLGIGLLVRTAAGRVTRRVLERRVFEQIPGYRLAKAFTGDGPLAEHGGRASSRPRGDEQDKAPRS